MAADFPIELATLRDAPCIAAMSRDLIETGLGWSWRASRVARHIRAPDSVVLAARGAHGMAGFAVMCFGEEEARLNLFAVAPTVRRAGIGRRLLEWLERSALVAGVSVVYLEVRATNSGARGFYERLGYCTVERVPGYYRGREAAIRMARDLWCPRVARAT